jgi:PAS domain S-box-containing protein
MESTRLTRPLWRYFVAVGVSVLALAIIAILQPVVGFLELLFLFAVALVDTYAGEGPAVLTIALCTLGSLRVINQGHVVDQRIHDLTKLAVFPLIGAGLLYLMRARRQQRFVARKQLSELSTLLESIPEAVFIFDSDGTLADFNTVALELCGLTRERLLERSIDDIARLLRIQAESGSPLQGELAVKRALRGETVRDERRMCYNPAHHDLPMNMMVSAYPMRNEMGKVIGATVVLRDVTELTQMQQRIADTERHLAIGQLASSIAHDFNNVLNTIQQAVAVLELSPDQREAKPEAYVALISKAVRRGAEVVQRLRDYVRGSGGELKPVEVGELLHEVLELTRPLLQREQRITLITELRPVDAVRGNAADLRRIFTNLVINAIQAMPKGGEIRISTEQRESKVRIMIRDTGPGVAPENRKKIFLPYFTTKASGTGLGLSSAQRTLLAQGGNISFTSEMGRGSCFTIELPSARDERPARAA